MLLLIALIIPYLNTFKKLSAKISLLAKKYIYKKYIIAYLIKFFKALVYN